MALFPQRHAQKDFFVLDIADVVPKDDTASMEHPMFSLATKPDMRHLHYQNGDNSLEIIPSGLGLPTIFDKDILIFCISQLMHRKKQGKPIGNKVRFSGRELLIATNRTTDGRSYRRLDQAFKRLIGTTFSTNIRTGDKIETQIFSMVDRGGFIRTADDKFQLDYCEVVLSDWMMRAIEDNEVLSINEDYFRIRRPLERRIYEICRKHCGKQDKWQISLEKLQNKTGSNAAEKKFRYNIQKIIEDNSTPDYQLELSSYDIVTVRPRKTKQEITAFFKQHHIPDEAIEAARFIAREKGLDYYATEADFLSYANEQASKGKMLKDIGKAFVGFCKKRKT